MYALDVLASDASLWLELGTDRFRLSGVAGGEPCEAEAADPFDRSIARFIDAVRGGRGGPVLCTPGDALGTLRVALACEQALAERRAIAVSPAA